MAMMMHLVHAIEDVAEVLWLGAKFLLLLFMCIKVSLCRSVKFLRTKQNKQLNAAKGKVQLKYATRVSCKYALTRNLMTTGGNSNISFSIILTLASVEMIWA